MSDKDGGPAFPDVALENPGMSLRDYFAAHALMNIFVHGGNNPITQIAKACYEIADAMLKERAK